MVARGELWWADLEEPRGSEPGYRRPFLIVQANAFNLSSLPTVVAVALTTNLRLQAMDGNVLLPAGTSGLPRDSVVNVTQIATINIADLTERIGLLPPAHMARVDGGLRIVLGLGR